MENQLLVRLIACTFTLIGGGCVSLTDQSSVKVYDLPHNSLVQVVPIVPEVVNTGGLACDEEGVLYFANYLHSGTIGQYKMDESAPPATFIDLNEWMISHNERSPNVNGLTMDSEGRLIGADAGTGKVIRVSPDANKVEVLADSYEGMLFGGVRDVALSPDGLVYASSPDEGVIYRIRPDMGEIDIVNQDPIRADGLAISPNGSQLVVTEPDAARLLVYALDEQILSGVPVATLDFSDAGESPRGVAFDEIGRLYVGMGELGTVNVFDLAEARLLRTYDAGGSADRLLFRNGSLWVSGGRIEGLRRLRLKPSWP